MISFLKKEDDEGSKFMGKGDIVFLLVVALIVGGFWFYSKTIKAQASGKFQECEKLWEAKQLVQANECYTQASDLQYLTDSLDSIIYSRNEAVQEIMDQENALWAKADSAMSRMDSAAAFVLVKTLPEFYFLDSVKVRRLSAWQAMAKDRDSAASAIPNK
ncbi:MAG TPA: hypothetical protein VLM37_05430 [Fibrobacteraceae bacterium]|nr:hypothetical protein [Fibrobacteraceae bacterium]